MKLNKQKWIQEVRRVEAEIKALKKTMHEPHYQTTFNFPYLNQLKAEATRLYTLRRVMKKKNVELKTFCHFTQSRDGKYIWTYWKRADNLTTEEIVALILDGVPGWKDGFLLDEPISTVPPQDTLIETVVF